MYRNIPFLCEIQTNSVDAYSALRADAEILAAAALRIDAKRSYVAYDPQTSEWVYYLRFQGHRLTVPVRASRLDQRVLNARAKLAHDKAFS